MKLSFCNGHAIDQTKGAKETNAILVKVLLVAHDFCIVVFHGQGEGTVEMVIEVRMCSAIFDYIVAGVIVELRPLMGSNDVQDFAFPFKGRFSVS